jgi:hypothetical protein
MKNELIIARRTGKPNRAAAQRLHALLEEFGLTALLDTRFVFPAGAESTLIHGDNVAG